MPGDHENIAVLNAGHRGVFKFDQSQTDQDNFELVRSNIRKHIPERSQNWWVARYTICYLSEKGAEHVNDGEELEVRWAKLSGDYILRRPST